MLTEEYLGFVHESLKNDRKPCQICCDYNLKDMVVCKGCHKVFVQTNTAWKLDYDFATMANGQHPKMPCYNKVKDKCNVKFVNQNLEFQKKMRYHRKAHRAKKPKKRKNLQRPHTKTKKKSSRQCKSTCRYRKVSRRDNANRR